MFEFLLIEIQLIALSTTTTSSRPPIPSFMAFLVSYPPQHDANAGNLATMTVIDSQPQRFATPIVARDFLILMF